MSRVVVDTGIFYALLDEKDSYHQRSQSEMQRIVDSNTAIYVPFPVFLETYSLLLYQLGFLAAKEFTEYCLDCVEFLNPTPEDYLQAKEKVMQNPDQTITLVDATTAVLSAKMNIPIWTYDYHFDVMGSLVWRD